VLAALKLALLVGPFIAVVVTMGTTDITHSALLVSVWCLPTALAMQLDFERQYIGVTGETLRVQAAQGHDPVQPAHGLPPLACDRRAAGGGGGGGSHRHSYSLLVAIETVLGMAPTSSILFVEQKKKSKTFSVEKKGEIFAPKQKKIKKMSSSSGCPDFAAFAAIPLARRHEPRVDWCGGRCLGGGGGGVPQYCINRTTVSLAHTSIYAATMVFEHYVRAEVMRQRGDNYKTCMQATLDLVRHQENKLHSQPPSTSCCTCRSSCNSEAGWQPTTAMVVEEVVAPLSLSSSSWTRCIHCAQSVHSGDDCSRAVPNGAILQRRCYSCHVFFKHQTSQGTGTVYVDFYSKKS